MALPKIEHLGEHEMSASRVVRVSVPAKALYDLDSVQKIQKDILGKLNCGACCSGYHILWDIERQFRVDDNLRVQGR